MFRTIITVAAFFCMANIAQAQTPQQAPKPAPAAQKWVGLGDITDPKTGEVYKPTNLSRPDRWNECVAEGGHPFADTNRARAGANVNRDVAVTYKGCPILVTKARAEDLAKK